MIEALISMVVISLCLLTAYSLLSQSANVSRETLNQSSRNMVLASLMNEVDPDHSNFFSTYETPADPLNTINDNGPNGGTQIPYARKPWCPDGILEPHLYAYVYRTPEDDSPVLKAQSEFDVPEIRVDAGRLSGAFVDSSGQAWMPETLNNWEGCWIGHAPWDGSTEGTSATAITNTDNDVLYQTFRQGDGMYYMMPIPPGVYNVQLYFAEMDPTITASSPFRRRADIYIEGQSMISSYSTRESTGATGKAEVLNFDVSVNDWWMEIEIYRSWDSDYDPRLAGFTIRKKLVW